MDRIGRILLDLECGVLPQELDFFLSFEKSIENKCVFKAVTKDFVIDRLDPQLIDMFPCLTRLVDDVYQEIKDKTPLQEMERLQKEISCIIIEDDERIGEKN